MTRCQADPGQMPSANMLKFYRDRSQCGLIVTEATCVSDEANAYLNTPGIYTAEQAQAWHTLVNKVQEQDAKIFMQLWHAGMMSHRSFRQGQLPLSPSGVKPLKEFMPRSQIPYEAPHPMTASDFDSVIRHFVQAAVYAVRLSQCDGIELHAANGYLFDSFLHHSTNLRTDRYGGTPENMSRFLLEVVDAIAEAIGDGSKIGVRLSPVPPPAMATLLEKPEDQHVFQFLLEQLSKRSLAYIHLSSDDDHKIRGFLPTKSSQFLRHHYHGTLIAGGNYSLDQAEDMLRNNGCDLIYFGRKILANPDLIAKMASEPLPHLTSFSSAMIARPPGIA